MKIIDAALDRYREEMFRVKVASAISQLLNVLSAIISACLVGIFIKGTSIGEQWFIVLLLLAFSAGDLARSALSDVNLLELYIAHTLPDFLQAAIVTPIALVIIGYFHWSLLLVLAPFLIASATVPDWLSKKAEQQGRVLRSAADEMSADVMDSIQGLREIAVFGAKKVSMKKPDTYQNTSSEAYVSYESRSGGKSIFENERRADCHLPCLSPTLYLRPLKCSSRPRSSTRTSGSGIPVDCPLFWTV